MKKELKKTLLCSAALVAVSSALFAEKFSIAVISDTQNYCDYRYQRDSNPPYPYDHGDIYKRQMQYIADNSKKNGGDIAFAIHVGDIVQNGAEKDSEWKIADDAMSILDDKVPYLMVPGNHDYDSQKNHSIEGLKTYAKYFGPNSKHFAGKKWYSSADKIGANSYAKFTADGKEIMVLGLQTEPDLDDIAWAQKVLDVNKNIPVILNVHEFLGLNAHASGDGWMRLMEFDLANNQIIIKTYSTELNRYETDIDSQFTIKFDFDWNKRFKK